MNPVRDKTSEMFADSGRVSNGMKLLYITNMRFPTEKAQGKQVKEMCNALVELVPVTLFVSARKTEGTPASFGLDPRVRVVYIPVLLVGRLGRVGFLVEAFSFAIAASLRAVFSERGSQVLTREYGCAVALSLAGFRVSWESHRGEWNWLVSLAVRLGTSLVVITQGLRDLYLQKGVSPERILLAPDGADLKRYRDLPSREEARRAAGLPQDKKIVIYNGHLHTWKGAGTLAKAASLLPSDFLVVFMGGTDEDIAKFKEKYSKSDRVAIIGRREDKERPLYLRAANAAVLPNTAEDEISVRYTSPLKLFGYMGAGVPILASDLPSIREVLSEELAFFATPDDPASFARALETLAANQAQADVRAQRAQDVVKQYSWDKRAASILSFLRI